MDQDTKPQSEHFFKLLSILLLLIIIAIGFYWWKSSNYTFPSFGFASSEVEEEGASEEDEENTEASSPSKSSAPVTPVKQYPIAPGSKIYQNGIPVTIVYFTSDGFKPADITIKAGEEVRFVNDTKSAMRVGVRSELSTSFYSSFAQPGFSQVGESFQIGFSKVGIIVYENLPTSNGTLGVINIE